MRHIWLILCLALLCGCAAQEPVATVSTTEASTVPTTQPPTTAPTEPPDPILEMLGDMSLEQRVGQLFLARCQDDTALEDIQQLQLGGFVLFAADFDGQTPETVRQKLANYQAASSIPLLIAVDEEGGTVTRVSRFSPFRSSPFPSPRSAYSQGGLEGMLALEEEKCQLLTGLGINVNLGPVCDLSTQTGAFMYDRSLGLPPQEAGTAAAATVRLYQGYRLGSVLKHFPGYGNNDDTHTGIALDERPLEELEARDLVPFSCGFQAGAGAVMVSHTIVSALDPELPASLSPGVHIYIRENMDYEGVILTDDLVMQAITDRYGAAEAAVMAVLAGNDLLCSTDYRTQYEAVLDAVLSGRIDIDTLNAATCRVLRWKQSLGLL